jgi:hypothetical protein
LQRGRKGEEVKVLMAIPMGRGYAEREESFRLGGPLGHELLVRYGPVHHFRTEGATQKLTLGIHQVGDLGGIGHTPAHGEIVVNAYGHLRELPEFGDVLHGRKICVHAFAPNEPSRKAFQNSAIVSPLESDSVSVDDQTPLHGSSRLTAWPPAGRFEKIFS